MPPKASTSRKRKSAATKPGSDDGTTSPVPVAANGVDADVENIEQEEAAEAEQESEGEQPKKKVKKAAKPKEPVKPLDDSLPTNTTMPETLSFTKPEQGVIRITNWNVCGMKAAEKKGMRRYIDAEDADIVILSETKMADPGFDWLNERYAHRYWGTDPKKGYAGTAILSKIEPLDVTVGLPTAHNGDLSQTAGRIVTLEFANSYVIGTYVPNAGAGLKEMPRKEAWNAAFEEYVRELDAKKPVIWGGDLNVVPTPEDVRNWKTNYEKSAGCTSKEINAFNRQLNPGEGSGHGKLVDVWRKLHPDVVGHYSYYGLRFQCRVKGIGWRLDYAVVSERLLDKVKQCEIRQEVYGCSDHVPVVLDIQGPL